MLNQNPKGDFHNFNKFVKQIDFNGAKVFSKPRPVFWELYFFGKESPLKEIFSSTTIKMNLELSSSRSFFDNDVVAIEVSQRPIVLSDYFSFGQLLAYCYYFGLQDLHKDNLLIVPDGIQVIDLEQAFSELLLPNHSLLLPVNKNITWSAGINILSKATIDQLTALEAKHLIDGFATLSNLILNQIEKIRLILTSSLSNFEIQPMRIFFRGTRDYVEKLQGISKVQNWFPEEKLQLDRNDVPYFFMFMNKEPIHYYTSESWNTEQVIVPEDFKRFANYCAKNPLDIFKKSKIEQQRARGMLYLVNKMSILVGQDLNWDSCSILITDEQIEFSSPNIRMITKKT